VQVRPFYNAYSGFTDELIWAAVWLHRASGEGDYLDFITNNAASLNPVQTYSELTWDLKQPGAQILIARQVLSCGQSVNPLFVQMKASADFYVCQYVNGGVPRTPDGLAFVRAIPTQHAMNAAFATMVYSDYLTAAGATLTCGTNTYTPDQVGR
jgi:endoglucanase